MCILTIKNMTAVGGGCGGRVASDYDQTITKLVL
jgi:hypothetical protein